MKNDIKYHISGNNLWMLEKHIKENNFDLNYFDPKDWYAETYLMTAANNGKLDMIKLLLKYGADPTVKNFKGRDLIFTIVNNIRWAKKMHSHNIPQFKIYGWIKLSKTQDELIEKFPHLIFRLKKYKLLRKNIEQKYLYLLQAKDLNIL